jgi:hypothetical protein
MLPSFCAFRERAIFVRGMDGAFIYFSGPVEAEDGTYVAAPAGWLFCYLMANSLFGEEVPTSAPRWL